jgi:O-antigen/teichoic acid export membrane protein
MSNRWYLEWFVDTESVAIFTVLASIALILPTAIQSLVNAYYIPIIYQKENKQPGYTAKFMNRFAIYFVVFSSFLAFFLSIFSSEVVVLFSSAVYVDYAPALTWMVFAYSLYILSSIMAIEVFAAKKTFYLLLPNIVPGIISMLLGYYMIKKYGLDGAFYSYLITYSAYAVLMFATIYVFRRKELALERIS